MTAITMCSLVGALLSSMSRVKDHVAGGGLSGWGSDAFVDSMRDMLPYVVYVGSCVYWATLIMSYASISQLFPPPLHKLLCATSDGVDVDSQNSGGHDPADALDDRCLDSLLAHGTGADS